MNIRTYPFVDLFMFIVCIWGTLAVVRPDYFTQISHWFFVIWRQITTGISKFVVRRCGIDLIYFFWAPPKIPQDVKWYELGSNCLFQSRKECQVILDVSSFFCDRTTATTCQLSHIWFVNCHFWLDRHYTHEICSILLESRIKIWGFSSFINWNSASTWKPNKSLSAPENN